MGNCAEVCAEVLCLQRQWLDLHPVFVVIDQNFKDFYGFLACFKGQQSHLVLLDG